MARVSKDDTSWKAGNVKRRDKRSVISGPEVVKHQSSKDTRRWCRGKKGVPHTPEWKNKNSFSGKLLWRIKTCAKCGKKLGYDFKSSDYMGSR